MKLEGGRRGFVYIAAGSYVLYLRLLACQLQILNDSSISDRGHA